MNKIWIAYLIPKEDHFLLVEDGIGYIAKGSTADEARANLHKLVEEGQTPEDIAFTIESHTFHLDEI